MEFADVVKIRRSVRLFEDRMVETEKITQVLEAARLAPSCKNLQCWDFVVITKQEVIQSLADNGAFNKNTWVRHAPVMIIACGDPEKSVDRNDINYFSVDVAIAMEHLVLAAADIGLGTCWIGIFEETILKQNLGIPSNLKIVALTPLGYPARPSDNTDTSDYVDPRSNQRRSITDICHYEKW